MFQSHPGAQVTCPLIQLVQILGFGSPSTHLVGGSWGMAALSERGSPAAKFTWGRLSRTTAPP